MKRAPKRSYRMRARAEAAARTADAIVDATVSLWRERPLDEITLEAIAERAGISVRTVIRRFGSRDGVLAATIEAQGARVSAERDEAAPGDVEGAIGVLLRHYERDGDAVVRTLALEAKLPEARAVVEVGRASHRGWCARVFGPLLPEIGSSGYEGQLDGFVAATDVYVWKLMRRDLGRSRREVEQVIRMLVEGVAKHTP